MRRKSGSGVAIALMAVTTKIRSVCMSPWFTRRVLRSLVNCAHTTHQSNLSNHIRSQHLATTKHICPECEFTTTSKASFKRHFDMKHILGTFSCLECDYVGKSKLLLYIHRRRRHKQMKGDYQCQLCNYETKTYSCLNTHYLFKHSNTRTHKCSLCESRFNTATHLKDHIAAVHDQVMNYACEHCPYKGATRNRLRRHNINCERTRR